MKITFEIASALLIPLLVSAPVRAAGVQGPGETSTASLQLHISVFERDGETVPTGSESIKGYMLLVTDSTGAPAADSAVVLRLPDEEPSGSFADGTHSAIAYTAADGRAKISGIKWGSTTGSVAIQVTATRGDARAGMLLQQMLTAGSATPVVAEERVSRMPKTQSQVPQPGVSVSEVKAPVPHMPDAKGVTATDVSGEPAVSVVHSKGTEKGYHSSHKKWIIVAALVAAGAGAGLMAAGKKKSSSSSSTTGTSGVSIGSPSVNVGAP